MGEENLPMIDPYTSWELNRDHVDNLLRQAEAAKVVASLPSRPSGLRLRVSGWLYALAARLEPSTTSVRPEQAHAR
jgi:hypothetical protein